MTTCLVAGQGVASNSTSLARTASANDDARAPAPAFAASCFISSDSGWREPKITVWPFRAHRVPSAPPTLPEPIIPIVIPAGYPAQVVGVVWKGIGRE
ncbi:MAG TPA: hypothetical protein VNY05_43560 [Candidatus Acidoferrales bacterium]|nr:hypothetical protein [Candidatus Acidoferrales bacterium]